MFTDINGIPAVIYGSESRNVYIYVHGMMGRKEDAEEFSRVADKNGFQVLSFDLQGHGQRKSNVSPTPFNTLPELETVHDFASSRWKNISLYAVSIGAWLSLLHFSSNPPLKTLLVSPVVNMKSLIERMMKNAGVTPEILKAKGTIPEANLSWEYYSFACENVITHWECETKILYPEHDNITLRFEIEEFAEKFGCDLCVVTDAEHWLHTEEELKFLRDWERKNVSLIE